MSKIKDSLSSIWEYIVLGVAALIGILIYIAKSKQKEINALKARIELVDTQKKADLIEVEIKQKFDNTNLLAKEITELENNLKLLEDKRKEIAKGETSKTSDQIEDFWKK